jgi:hypothetical protein
MVRQHRLRIFSMKSLQLYPSNKGSAFVSVLLLTTVLTIALVSIMRWSVGERTMTVRNTRWLEARNAAEAVTEYGFSQVRNQYNTKASPPSFDPLGSARMVLPPSSFWQNSNVVVSSLELIAGSPSTVPGNGTLFYVDPNNLNNEFDPLKGQWVFRRDVQLVGKATVNTPGGGPPITSYVTQTISIRGAPLFANAIFYGNNDLEIFPGPLMDIYGPVHSNGNIFVSSQGSSLNFHGPVSCSGHIFHAWASTATSAHGSGNETLGQSPVTFVNTRGAQVTMNPAGMSTSWKDSTMGADTNISGLSNLNALVTPVVSQQFAKNASQTWGGNLQTGAMGIQAYTPISYNLPVGVDGGGNPIPADPHSIIDPPTTLTAGDPYYAGKAQVEQEKFSTQTGLYIRAVVTSGVAGAPATATFKLYGQPLSAVAAGITDITDPAYALHWKNGGVLLTPPANLAGTTPLVKFTPYKATVRSAGAKIGSGVNSGKYPITTLTATSGGSASAVTYSASNAVTSTVNSGLYDKRRSTTSDPTYTKGGVDLIEVDIGALRAAVETMISNVATNDSIKSPDGAAVWNGWNGGVYVEVQTFTAAGVDVTGTPAQSASVRVINGQLPLTTPARSLIPSYGVNGNGLTLVTNAPLYIKGHFNADGTIVAGANGSSTLPDDGKTGSTSNPSAESPACLAGDAITILSPGWSDAASLVNNNAASGHVEIAAAFLAGIVATDPNGAGHDASSGGAHNLPRFLENWGSSRTVAIRGSLCCLYPSKVATQPWAIRYYGAPSRSWGFDSIFANGNFPPLTPKVVSYRRVAFRDISATAYAAAKHQMWPSVY